STRSGVSVVTVTGNLADDPGSAMTDGYGVVICTPAASTVAGSRPTTRRKAARLARRTRIDEQTPLAGYFPRKRSARIVTDGSLRLSNVRDGVLLTRPQAIHSRRYAGGQDRRWRPLLTSVGATRCYWLVRPWCESRVPGDPSAQTADPIRASRCRQ